MCYDEDKIGPANRGDDDDSDLSHIENDNVPSQQTGLTCHSKQHPIPLLPSDLFNPISSSSLTSSLLTHQISSRSHHVRNDDTTQIEVSNVGLSANASITSTGANMDPPQNRTFLLGRDFQGSVLSPTDLTAPYTSGAAEHTLFGCNDTTDVRSELADDDDESNHNNPSLAPVDHSATSPIHLQMGSYPRINSASDSLNAAIRQYNDANKFLKPAAPSSVKSFGSNIGSDDCGGSLDVETHSVDARSIHSQEDNLPIVMPEHDPETVAVASLSINPSVETDIQFDSLYKNRNMMFYKDQGSHLHQNITKINTDDHEPMEAVDGSLSLKEYQQILQLPDNDDDYRTNINWNDPRKDNREQDSRQQKINSQAVRDAKQNRRTRSRSRSPRNSR